MLASVTVISPRDFLMYALAAEGCVLSILLTEQVTFCLSSFSSRLECHTDFSSSLDFERVTIREDVLENLTDFLRAEMLLRFEDPIAVLAAVAMVYVILIKEMEL